MNSVIVPADFIEDVVFELDVEGRVHDHRLQRIEKTHQQPNLHVQKPGICGGIVKGLTEESLFGRREQAMRLVG